MLKINDKRTKKVVEQDEEEEIVFNIIDGDEAEKKKYEDKRNTITKLFKN